MESRFRPGQDDRFLWRACWSPSESGTLDDMPLQAPLARSTHAMLREMVLELRDAESGQRYPTVIHAGLPWGPRAAHDCSLTPTTDSGLRTDIAMGLLERTSIEGTRPLLWLTRPGPLSVQDCDLEWRSATQWAAGALAINPAFLVVTRQGWFEPDSGRLQEWRRLRRHSTRRALASRPQSHW